MTSCKGNCQPYVLWKLNLVAMFVNNLNSAALFFAIYFYILT